MKSLFKNFLIIAVITTAISFTVVEYEVKNTTAEVEQYEGLSVFADAKPVKDFDYLGSEKLSVVWNNKYETWRDALIKKAKKDYPQADAIIMHLSKGQADVIKFK